MNRNESLALLEELIPLAKKHDKMASTLKRLTRPYLKFHWIIQAFLILALITNISNQNIVVVVLFLFLAVVTFFVNKIQILIRTNLNKIKIKNLQDELYEIYTYVESFGIYRFNFTKKNIKGAIKIIENAETEDCNTAIELYLIDVEYKKATGPIATIREFIYEIMLSDADKIRREIRNK